MSGQLPAVAGPGQADAAVEDVHVERARGGDLVAFRELLRTHKARVFSLALRLLGQRADAEEVAQDVFLQLHGSAAADPSATHLKHWLLRTVSHRCIDRLRSAGSRPQLVPMDALPAGVEPAAPDEGYDPLVAAQVHRLLLQLAPEARAVLLLRFQEDLDPSDIATALAISMQHREEPPAPLAGIAARANGRPSMNLEQTLRVTFAPCEPAADFEDVVMARMSAAAWRASQGPRRKHGRVILLGTMLAVAAAAGMLALLAEPPAEPLAVQPVEEGAVNELPDVSQSRCFRRRPRLACPPREDCHGPG